MRDEALDVWTVYDRPRDFPDLFVARKWRIVPGDLPMPSSEIITATSLLALRNALPPGLVCLLRDKNDEPKIIEVWL